VELRVLEYKGFKVSKAQLMVREVLKVFKVSKEFKVIEVFKVSKEIWDPLEFKEFRVIWGFKVLSGLLDWAFKAHKVFKVD
jgi:hypothetical protein